LKGNLNTFGALLSPQTLDSKKFGQIPLLVYLGITNFVVSRATIGPSIQAQLRPVRESLRQPDEVRIEGANHDASMSNGSALMEAEKVQTILSEQHAVATRRKCEHFLVGDRSVRVPRLQWR
jgi:hypothetical protein